MPRRDTEQGNRLGRMKETRTVGGNMLGGLFKAGSANRSQEEKEEDARNGRSEVGDKDASIAASSQHTQARKRKGSLRQAAMAKMREHSSSLLREYISLGPTSSTSTQQPSAEAQKEHLLDGMLGRDPESQSINLSSHTPEAPGRPVPHLLASPVISSPEDVYASTTEDERSPEYQASASSSISSFGLPANHNLSSLRRRSHHSDRRPSIDVHPLVEPDFEDEWDYSETEWWGWIILIVTWVVFVVVMGSCFGVWSWAWDVGETPYAPPELEDDDTLPITGYYPVLIVCTAVMSWVWVVIAWVGMKYFRHAKVV